MILLANINFVRNQPAEAEALRSEYDLLDFVIAPAKFDLRSKSIYSEEFKSLDHQNIWLKHILERYL
jgi:hypothetical protein